MHWLPNPGNVVRYHGGVPYFRISMRIDELDKKPLDVKTLTVKEIANKHDVPVEQIERELAMGIQVELEHTTSEQAAREIALDHLLELPDYYTKLNKMENE